MEQKSVVVDLPVICRNFPQSILDEIDRGYLLDTIDMMLNESNIVVLVGENGIGKTTLLSQYAKRYSNTTISCFINPYSKFGYSPDNIRLIIAEQIYWIVKKAMFEDSSIDPVSYNDLMIRLERMAKRKGEPFVFLIDGIDDIPEEDRQYTSDILREILPIGEPNLRFLFSGADDKYYSDISGISTSWRIPFFNPSEIREYFGNQITSTQLEEIKNMCRSIPSRLASVKRLIQAGKSVDEIIKNDPKEGLDFIRIEFESIQHMSHKLADIFTILAFSTSRFSINDIALILGEDSSEIRDEIKNCLILNVNASTDINEVIFISNPHRVFALKEYANRRQWAISKIIDYIQGQVNSVEKITELPDYLKRANRYDELLNLLTSEHFSKVIEQTETISSLINQIELGLDASISVNKYLPLFDFSVLKSISLELGGIESTYAEIEARLTFEEVDKAVLLANSAVLKEDRLRLLSYIVKYCQTHDMLVEDSVRKKISLLANQVDFSYFGDDASVIASNLILTDPDLAIEIMEKSIAKRDDAESDTAYLNLTLLTQASNSMSAESDQLIQKAASKIQNPMLLDFISRASIFWGKCNEDEVINRLDGATFMTKIFCLRSWAKASKNAEHPEIVINYAIDEMIKNTAYLPRLKVLCDFAYQIPNIRDNEVASKIVKRFDSMITSVEQISCSQDNTQIQLLLARSDYRYNIKGCKDRLSDLFLDISKISDVVVKTECLALMKVELSRIDESGEIEKSEQFGALVEEELEKSICLVINGSSDHYSLLRGLIQTLSPFYPHQVKGIIKKINTQFRREQSYVEMCKTILNQEIQDIDFNIVLDIVKNDLSIRNRWGITLVIFSALYQKLDDIKEENLETLLPFIEIIKNIKSSQTRCQCACHAYSIFMHIGTAEKYTSICDELEDIIEKSHEAIDPAWLKLEYGYKMVQQLAKYNTKKAQELFLECDIYSKKIPFKTAKAVNNQIRLILLAIRAFPPLFTREQSSAEHIQFLETLINSIPSVAEQINLWGNLALHSYIQKQKELGDGIVETYIWPALDQFPALEEVYKAEIVNRIAPALYINHHSRAVDYIRSILEEEQDEAFFRICEYMIKKTTWNEPFDAKLHQGFKLDYSEALSICDVLAHIKTDGTIYSVIRQLTDSLVVKANRNSISGPQMLALKDKLSTIIHSKLPNTTNITHTGYLIVCEGLIMRLIRTSKADWEKLIQETLSISNIADRGYIFSVLTYCIPSTYHDIRKKCIDVAIEEIEKIPSDSNKIDLYITLAEEINSIDESMTRSVLRKAMESSMLYEDPEAIFPKQKRIIDRANIISPEYAEQLAALFDTDPARMKARIDSVSEDSSKIMARIDLHEYLEMLKVKNDLVNKSIRSEANESERQRYAQSAARALGSLNAGLSTPYKLDETGQFLTIASKLPFNQAYPIYLWFIVNLVIKNGNTPIAFEMFEQLFKSLVSTSNFILGVSNKSIKLLKEYSVNNSEDDGVENVIDNEDPEKVRAYLLQWMESELGEYLYICDPYFSNEDLDLVNLVSSVRGDCSIIIITGDTKKTDVSPDQQFRTTWKNISDAEPPDTEIVYATFSSGKPVFHDRGWITNKSGLKFGSSANAIGSPRISHISKLTRDELKKWRTDIDPFLNRVRNYKGEKVNYLSFYL